jgi:hypothetical protein
MHVRFRDRYHGDRLQMWGRVMNSPTIEIEKIPIYRVEFMNVRGLPEHKDFPAGYINVNTHGDLMLWDEKEDSIIATFAAGVWTQCYTVSITQNG